MALELVAPALLAGCASAPRDRPLNCIPVNDDVAIPLEDGLLTVNGPCPNRTDAGRQAFLSLAHSLVQIAYGDDFVFTEVKYEEISDLAYWRARSAPRVGGGKTDTIEVNSRPIPLKWGEQACAFYTYRPQDLP